MDQSDMIYLTGCSRMQKIGIRFNEKRVWDFCM